MKKTIIVRTDIQTRTLGAPQQTEAVWIAAFEKDLAGRLKKNGSDLQKVGPSNMTMMIARMTQHYAEMRDYDGVLALTSALTRDPGAPLMLSGDEAQQAVAYGLLGMAHRVAKDSRCSNRVQKSIITHVLNLCYQGGQGAALIELAKKPSTPKELAFATAIVFTQHKDLEALEQMQGIGHDAMLTEMVRKCIANLDV